MKILFKSCYRQNTRQREGGEAVLGIRKLSKVVAAFLVNICKKALPPPPFYICLLSYFSFPFLTFCYLASFLIFFYTSYYSFYVKLCSLFWLYFCFTLILLITTLPLSFFYKLQSFFCSTFPLLRTFFVLFYLSSTFNIFILCFINLMFYSYS